MIKLFLGSITLVSWGLASAAALAYAIDLDSISISRTDGILLGIQGTVSFVGLCIVHAVNKATGKGKKPLTNPLEFKY